MAASLIQSITKGDTSVAKNPRLKTCPWYTTDYLSPQDTTSGPFGDRRHYFFFCTNANIARFRFTATSLIETKLRQLYTTTNKTSPDGANILLHRVEKTLLALQNTNAGRLHSEAGEMATVANFISITGWLAKQGLQSVFEGIRSSTFILVCIFGAQTALPDRDLPHESIGVAYVIHLGLMPTFLDTVITTTFTELNRHYMRVRLPETPGLDLLTIWEQAKDHIKTRAIGIHRLITSENKAFRKHLQDQYGIRLQRKNSIERKH